MKVIQEELHEDGSAWSAVVEVSGILFRATYVASKLSVGLVPYKRPPCTPRWGIRSVRDWAEKRINSLPCAWMTLHRLMYNLAADSTEVQTPNN